MSKLVKRRERLGGYATSKYGSETVRAFVPPKLPPHPSIDMERLEPWVEKANIALGQVDGLIQMLPNLNLFIYGYIRKEALLSSEIEGTQSTLTDLMLYESKQIPGVPLDDVQEVSNYISALQYGIKRLKGGFPLCLRLICEVHEKLLKKGRGAFRKSQNWIGGTRPGNAKYVPPPVPEMLQALHDLELFLHEENKLPVVVKCGLIHAQFETIHPFLDGNGRVGRLLILFYLMEQGLLSQPVLYLSLYLKRHRSLYYEHLQSIREGGDWESWLEFFLEGITVSCREIMTTSKALQKCFDVDSRKIAKLSQKQQESTQKLHTFLKRQVMCNVSFASNKLKLTPVTTRNAFLRLEKLGILKEVTQKQRGRIYLYEKAFKLLSK